MSVWKHHSETDVFWVYPVSTGAEQQVGLRETWRKMMTNSKNLFQMLHKGNFEQTHHLFNVKALCGKFLLYSLQTKKEPVNQGRTSSYKETAFPKPWGCSFTYVIMICFWRYLALTQRLLLYRDSSRITGLKIDCQRLKSKALKRKHVILPQVLQHSWCVANEQKHEMAQCSSCGLVPSLWKPKIRQWFVKIFSLWRWNIFSRALLNYFRKLGLHTFNCPLSHSCEYNIQNTLTDIAFLQFPWIVITVSCFKMCIMTLCWH